MDSVIVEYISSEACANVIGTVLKKLDILTLNPIISNDFYLGKHIKEKMSELMDVEKIVIDLSALNDLDDEITEALDALRYLDSQIGIIIVAPNREPGDPLLTQIFQMGIYDIISGSDYKKLQEELEVCLTIGKSYKDAIEYKTASNDRIVVKTETKQAVNKVMVGLAGSQKRIGVTHSTIQLAATLRKKGYMVAVVECNTYHPVLEILRDEYEEKILEDHYSIEGIDFYELAEEALPNALAKAYNFILCDFGFYGECDKVNYNKCHIRMMLSGSCAWEIDALNENVFSSLGKEALMEIYYLFLFTDPDRRKDIVKAMEDLSKVHFVEYAPDMFAPGFVATDEILKEYLPDLPEEKKRFFRRKKGKGRT